MGRVTTSRMIMAMTTSSRPNPASERYRSGRRRLRGPLSTRCTRRARETTCRGAHVMPVSEIRGVGQKDALHAAVVGPP